MTTNTSDNEPAVRPFLLPYRLVRRSGVPGFASTHSFRLEYPVNEAELAKFLTAFPAAGIPAGIDVRAVFDVFNATVRGSGNGDKEGNDDEPRVFASKTGAGRLTLGTPKFKEGWRKPGADDIPERAAVGSFSITVLKGGKAGADGNLFYQGIVSDWPLAEPAEDVTGAMAAFVGDWAGMMEAGGNKGTDAVPDHFELAPAAYAEMFVVRPENAEHAGLLAAIRNVSSAARP